MQTNNQEHWTVQLYDKLSQSENADTLFNLGILAIIGYGVVFITVFLFS